MSAIEWTDVTWNPVAGCRMVSRGCAHCYAETMSVRLAAMARKDVAAGRDPGRKGNYLDVVDGAGRWTGRVVCDEAALAVPLGWRTPRMVFVNSMSDLFYGDAADEAAWEAAQARSDGATEGGNGQEAAEFTPVPFEFVDRVFAVLALTPRHTYQILTKRPGRMAEYFESGSRRTWDRVISASEDFRKQSDQIMRGMKWDDWPLPNVWLGTSCEDQEAAEARVPELLRCPAAVRFLSCEPLLGPIDVVRAIGAAADEHVWSEAHEWGGDCELCGGDGVREYMDAPEEWGEDCPSEKNHLIVCRGCGELERDKRLRVVRKTVGDSFWVIAGGESGAGARVCRLEWLRGLRGQCAAAGVPLFVKQLGSLVWDGERQAAARLVQLESRKGGVMEEWPEDLRVREWPKRRAEDA